MDFSFGSAFRSNYYSPLKSSLPWAKHTFLADAWELLIPCLGPELLSLELVPGSMLCFSDLCVEAADTFLDPPCTKYTFSKKRRTFTGPTRSLRNAFQSASSGSNLHRLSTRVVNLDTLLQIGKQRTVRAYQRGCSTGAHEITINWYRLTVPQDCCSNEVTFFK